MAKKKHMKVTDDELVAAVVNELSNSNNNSLDSIAVQRIQSNKSFVNDWTDRTVPSTGMSGINFYFTPSVTNTLTMYMSKIFCSDKETVKFNPLVKSPETMQASNQLQQMVNEVLHKENRGFEIITEMFRSAAVNKMGVAKVIWDEKPEMFEEIYSDIPELMLPQIIEQRESEGYEVSIVESSTETVTIAEEVVDELTGEVISSVQEETTGTYTLRMKKMRGSIKIDVLPPEEFAINEDTTSIDSELTRFVAHSREMLRGDVAAVFPDVEVDELQSYDDLEDYYEKLARHETDGTLNAFFSGQDAGQLETDKVVITESWIRADRDGDGYPEWRHVFSCGQTLIEDEEWFGPLPFTAFTFFPIPHKFYGLSVYDRLRPYEEAATSLMRSDVDMARLKNTFRMLAKEGSVDRRNLQSGRPGVITTSATFDPKDVMVVPSPAGANNVPAILAELRQQVIADVGIDPVSGQVSTDIEKSGNDAAKTAMALDNASVKLEGYARRYAEGALRDIIWLITILLVRHSEEDFVKEIVESITPGQPFFADQMGLNKIMHKTGLTAKVGLGHQTAQQKSQAAGVVSQMILQLTQAPSAAMYNMTAEALKGFGYENPQELLGPLEEWVQKADLQQQLQQSQIQAQQQQAQVQQQQLQLQQQQVQGQLAIQQQESQAKIQREAMESQAKISLMSSQATKQTADADKQNVETEILLQTPIENVKGSL